MDIRDPCRPLSRHVLAKLAAAFMANHRQASDVVVVDDKVTIYPPVKLTFQSPPCAHFSRPVMTRGDTDV